MTDEEWEKLADLIKDYEDVFSKDELDLGQATLVKHRILTHPGHPVRQALRRQPLVHCTAMNQQTDEFLRAKIIEPASSEWASNVVLVKKKDGTLHFCVDYRQLN